MGQFGNNPAGRNPFPGASQCSLDFKPIGDQTQNYPCIIDRTTSIWGRNYPRNSLGEGDTTKQETVKKSAFSLRARHSAHEGFGKEFYRKDRSVKGSGPFNEPPDSLEGFSAKKGYEGTLLSG